MTWGSRLLPYPRCYANRPDISDETRERVLQRVKELNYEPNILARGLVTGRSYLVGLVVPDLLHPFFAEVAKELASTIRREGYSLIVSSSEEDIEMEQREIRHLRARRLDALVVAFTRTSMARLEPVAEEDDVLVLIDRELPGLSANYVGTDDIAAGRIATEHLIDVGCSQIAHIRGRENSTGVHRFEGYRQALRLHGMEYVNDYVISRNRVDEEGAEATRLLLQRRPRPDGIFCYNDPLAIGAMKTILEAGFRIPEDIALIGGGNLHYDGYLRVPLSSVDQQNQQLRRRAGKLVLSLIQSKQNASASPLYSRPRDSHTSLNAAERNRE